MCGTIAIYRNYLGPVEALLQYRPPISKQVLSQQESFAVFVYGALNRPVDAAGRVGIRSVTRQLQANLPNSLMLAKAINHPLCVGIGHLAFSSCLHRCSALAPPGDEDSISLQISGLGVYFLHQPQTSKAGVRWHQHPNWRLS